jgi:hypothetical protein
MQNEPVVLNGDSALFKAPHCRIQNNLPVLLFQNGFLFQS